MLPGAWGMQTSSPGKGVPEKGSSLRMRMDHAYVHILALLFAFWIRNCKQQEVEVSGYVLV